MCWVCIGHEIERQDVVNIFETVFLGLFTVELILKVRMCNVPIWV